MKKESIRKWENIPSSTNPARKYTVQMYADGSFSCDCPRWTIALRCRTCGGGTGVFNRGLIPVCGTCHGTGRAERNCTHIVGIQAVYRLRDIDMQIDAARNMPTVKRRITKAED